MFSISTNEQADPQEDINRDAIDTRGWVVSTPETALEFLRHRLRVPASRSSFPWASPSA
ncbi:MAG: hypothetical protein U1G05_13095 [Kiritimatiellia bacterium]